MSNYRQQEPDNQPPEQERDDRYSRGQCPGPFNGKRRIKTARGRINQLREQESLEELLADDVEFQSGPFQSPKS